MLSLSKTCCEAVPDSLLIFAPHERAHRALSILRGRKEILCVCVCVCCVCVCADPQQHASPPPPVDAAITQAKVEKSLGNMSNGKAAGQAGCSWAAELLRHVHTGTCIVQHPNRGWLQGQGLDVGTHGHPCKFSQCSLLWLQARQVTCLCQLCSTLSTRKELWLMLRVTGPLQSESR